MCFRVYDAIRFQKVVHSQQGANDLVRRLVRGREQLIREPNQTLTNKYGAHFSNKFTVTWAGQGHTCTLVHSRCSLQTNMY